MLKALVKSNNGIQAFATKLRQLKAKLNIGYFEESTYATQGKPIKVAQVAYFNEYGIGGNPPRPFLKRTLETNRKKYHSIANKTFGTYGISKESLALAYQTIGTAMVTDVTKTIKKWSPNDPRANKPSTIARKIKRGSKVRGKNLIPIDPYAVLLDTGTLIGSTKFKVVG